MASMNITKRNSDRSHLNSLFIFRGATVTPQFVDLIMRFKTETSFDLVFIADERNYKIDSFDLIDKYGIDDEWVRSNGLYCASDWGWKCGDYFYYRAQQQFPQYDFYWMIEPDVLINFDNLNDFFSLIPPNNDVDFIATDIAPSDGTWYWAPKMSAWTRNQIYKTFYPLTRLSTDAIDYLLSARRALSSEFINGLAISTDLHDWDWPNDEVFTATTLMNGAFTSLDLRQALTKTCGNFSFRHRYPHSVKSIAIESGRVYHPVLSDQTYSNKIYEILYNDTSNILESEGIDSVRRYLDSADTKYLLTGLLYEVGFENFSQFVAESSKFIEVLYRNKLSESRKYLIEKIWRSNDPFSNIQKDVSKEDSQGWYTHHPYLIDTIDEIRPKIIVEVGVWKGASSLAMAKHIKSKMYVSQLIAVDTWLGGWDHWQSDQWFEHLDMVDGRSSLFSKFMNNVLCSNVEDIIVPLPLDSTNAAHVLQHFGVMADLIHIDGGHDYEAVKNDIQQWWPLLRDGGVLVGDDYHTDGNWPGVKQAFDELVESKSTLSLESFERKCKIVKK